jgi:signal transduction histidine kinase/putative methionine-R-sulfoxide reductase with GAF domain
MALFRRVREDLPQDPERWKSALESALTVSEIAASGSALPEAVQKMVTVAIELLQAEQGSIMLLDEDGLTLVLSASYGLPSEVPVGHSIKVGESVAGRVLATGRPLLLGNVVDSDAFVNFVPKHRPASSSIVVPLRVQGRSIGVLSLAMEEGSPDFTEEDLRLAQMFADQAAGLIYRTKLHEQAEHRSSDLMALVESSRGLVGTLDVDTLLQHVLDGSVRLSGSNEGFACIFDPESGGIDRGVFRGLAKDQIQELLKNELVKEAIQAADIAFVELDGETFVAVGLHTSPGTTGVVVVRADMEVASDRRHLMRAFAQQCDTALSAAKVHGEMGRKERELSAIINGVANAIVLIDAHNKIVALNSAAEQLFNISAQFAVGAPVQGALGDHPIEELISNAGELQAEVQVGNPPRTYKARITDVEFGVPMGRVLMLDDVTTEREIVQKQRDFVAMIGHELRTPLTIIKGFAKTMLRKGKEAPAEDFFEGLRTIDTRAGLLERLIEDLLYVSQIESREASLRIDQVDMGELLQTVTEDIMSLQLEREAILEISRPLTWPCDETKIGLVLRHLIENALKYSEAPNPVVVRAAEDGDELRIDVIDKGMGIVSSDIPLIFERFRQVDASSTREHGGTGVGLYLCAQLVRMHNGQITVDSTWGKGSTFSFTLPRRAVASDVVHIRGTDIAATG